MSYDSYVKAPNEEKNAILLLKCQTQYKGNNANVFLFLLYLKHVHLNTILNTMTIFLSSPALNLGPAAAAVYPDPLG